MVGDIVAALLIVFVLIPLGVMVVSWLVGTMLESPPKPVRSEYPDTPEGRAAQHEAAMNGSVAKLGRERGIPESLARELVQRHIETGEQVPLEIAQKYPLRTSLHA